MKIKALAFDTGGTVLDWHAGTQAALRRTGQAHGLERDWHEIANDWRRLAMQGIKGQIRPSFNMDDVHRSSLDRTLAKHGLNAFTPVERDQIWHAWHRLTSWPDFGPALATLRKHFTCVSFTMLPTALAIDVSRLNGLDWDALITCEMIGVYKPHLEAYTTAARWLALAPSEILMVACHNFDLNAAKDAGLRTAFIRRPDEWGPAGPPDPEPNMPYDFALDDFVALVAQLTPDLG